MDRTRVCTCAVRKIKGATQGLGLYYCLVLREVKVHAYKSPSCLVVTKGLIHGGILRKVKGLKCAGWAVAVLSAHHCDSYLGITMGRFYVRS